MSSWERARHIPWDRIPQPNSRYIPGEPPPPSLEAQKERIFRQLHNEAREVESSNSQQNEVAAISTELGTDSTNNHKSVPKVRYSHMDLLKQAAFGGCIGSITGGVFGFMDGMRTAGESSVLQKASNSAKAKFLLQGTSRSAFIFGSFFGGFHMAKYGLKVSLNEPGDFAEIAMAAPLALGALAYNPTSRQAMPYAVMLVLMDMANVYMRQTN
jgi:hypothetical protein